MNRQAILPLALALFSCLAGWWVEPALAAAPGTDPTAIGPEPAATTVEPAFPPLQLILDRRSRLLKVMEGDRERRRFRVGVGMPGWETPVGSFSVIEKTAYPIWEHPAKGVRIPPAPPIP